MSVDIGFLGTKQIQRWIVAIALNVLVAELSLCIAIYVCMIVNMIVVLIFPNAFFLSVFAKLRYFYCWSSTVLSISV